MAFLSLASRKSLFLPPPPPPISAQALKKVVLLPPVPLPPQPDRLLHPPPKKGFFPFSSFAHGIGEFCAFIIKGRAHIFLERKMWGNDIMNVVSRGGKRQSNYLEIHSRLIPPSSSPQKRVGGGVEAKTRVSVSKKRGKRQKKERSSSLRKN